MDIFLSVLLLVGGAILALWFNAKNRKRDSEALEKEVSQDFEEEYDLREQSSGTELGPEMEDLIDWVTDTSIGLVTAIIAAGVVLCLCVGCCYQVCVGGVKKTAQDLVGEVGDLRTCWVSGQVGCCCARASRSFLQLAPTRQQHAGIRTAVIPPAQH